MSTLTLPWRHTSSTISSWWGCILLAALMPRYSCIRCSEDWITCTLLVFAIAISSLRTCWSRGKDWLSAILGLRRYCILGNRIFPISAQDATVLLNWYSNLPTIPRRLTCGHLDAFCSKCSTVVLSSLLTPASITFLRWSKCWELRQSRK